MAEENKSNAGTEGQKTKKSKKTLIIAGLGVLILTLGGGFAWKSGLAAKFMGGDKQTEQNSSAPGEKGKAMGPIYSLGSFIVNLDDPSGRRYLKVKAELELNDEKVRATVETQLPRLRDSIILLLSSKTFQEIASMEGKMRLRQEILGKLNQHVGRGKLNTIYFTEFVIQ